MSNQRVSSDTEMVAKPMESASSPQRVMPMKSRQSGINLSALNEEPKEPKTGLDKIRKMVEVYIECDAYIFVMSIITIWALFSDNIRIAATDRSVDEAWDVVISTIFFVFIMEILLSIFCKDDYAPLPSFEILEGETFQQDFKSIFARWIQVGSFYLWLDIIATCSFMFEISWMVGEDGDATFDAGDDVTRSGPLNLPKEVLNVIQMLNLVRLVKLYKYYEIYETRFIDKPVVDKAEVGDKTAVESGGSSKIGGAMSDVLSRRVIVLVLLMLIVITLLLAQETDQNPKYLAKNFHSMKATFSTSCPATPAECWNALNFTKSILVDNEKILYLKQDGELYKDLSSRREKLRSREVNSYYFVDSATGTTTSMMYDVEDWEIAGATLSMYLTVFVMVLLIGGIKVFQYDVKHLVVVPIENMVTLVKKISANPLGVEYNMLSEEAMQEGMETAFLLQTINKIGSLMKIGFGEAGAVVIAKNLGGGGNKLNLMGGGEMIHSIFGFCDVRQFTDTTECLQEEVMLFVNRIAFIIHGIVVQCSGAANKNIGDAFLLTWKIPQDSEPHAVSSLADQALLAFCKTMVELGRGQEFICNFSVSATGRLYKRFPGYKVRIGAGLHVGWAVEGAIGSNSKIDASYLSPHVNRTEFLESSTKAYGVPLLISEPFFKLLSSAVSKYCRQVDRVRTSPEEEPFNIYTYDMDVNLDFWDLPKANKALRLASSIMKSKIGSKRATINQVGALTGKNSAAQKIVEDEIQQKRDAREKAQRRQSLVPTTDLEAAKKPTIDPKAMLPNIIIRPYKQAMWEEDNELIQLRHMVNDSFRALWREGVGAYLKGDWPKARDIIYECLRRTNGEDGPSNNLVAAIDAEGGAAPRNWPGYRME